MADKTQIEEQKSEILQVKEKYGDRCKVITDIGDFTNVVSIRMVNVDATVKFQLTAAYPSEKPAVIVRSEVIPTASMPKLQDVINKVTSEAAQGSTMDCVIEALSSELRDMGFNDSERGQRPKSSQSSHKAQKKKTSKKQSGSGPKNSEAISTAGKKPSMKTAEDVIKRLQWDSSLKSEDFCVGYLDRFQGIVERSFGEFSWEDLASADYDVLTIPQHRIQYFKYRNVVVWDKNTRLDYVFGSVGDNICIHNVVSHYEHFEALQNTTGGIHSHPSIRSVLNPTLEEDDPVEVTPHHPHSSTETRPTHFVCVRVTEPEVLRHVEEVQTAILERQTRYASCCTRREELHLTLCTLGLDDAESVSAACGILKGSQEELRKHLAEDTEGLKLQGVDNFSERVIFARVHHSIQFTRFVDFLRGLFESRGVPFRSKNGYHPHVTLMKTSREISREMKTSKVDIRLYGRFTDQYFGKQHVHQIRLCEMNARRQHDRFYVTLETVDL